MNQPLHRPYLCGPGWVATDGKIVACRRLGEGKEFTPDQGKPDVSMFLRSLPEATCWSAPLTPLRTDTRYAVDCDECRGIGSTTTEETCEDCDGDGECHHCGHECETCDGRGTLRGSTGPAVTCVACTGTGKKLLAKVVRLSVNREFGIQADYFEQLAALGARVTWLGHIHGERRLWRWEAGELFGIVMPCSIGEDEKFIEYAPPVSIELQPTVNG